MSKISRKSLLIAATALVLIVGLALSVEAGPKKDTVSGVIADFTCAAKGKMMMDSWHNAANDTHKTPDGEKPGCATACLKGGQPAALFTGDELAAVFACNPRATLSEYAAQEVEVQGMWAGSGSDGAKSFVPSKIRAAGSGEWQDVNCATMH